MWSGRLFNVRLYLYLLLFLLLIFLHSVVQQRVVVQLIKLLPPELAKTNLNYFSQKETVILTHRQQVLKHITQVLMLLCQQLLSGVCA